jgi:hypothetical protein
LTKRSPKGKVPWITYNGTEISDSEFIIEYFCRKDPKKDLSAHLSPLDKAIVRPIVKMCEESLRWYECKQSKLSFFQGFKKTDRFIKKRTMLVHRFRYGKPEVIGFNFLTHKFVGRGILKTANSQGYGTHSQQEGKFSP